MKDSKMIPQHKRMAMGDMPKASGNSGKTGFEDCGSAAKPDSIKKSGTSTGSRGKRG